jgi:S-adenosylmethionine:tRNA ribosyltransferase-isomerase
LPMKTGDFDYTLPSRLIAQTPIEPRDHSRLMVLSRASHVIEHRRFFDLPDYLRSGDVLVFNDTRVRPARLAARKDTGAKLELLLLQRLRPSVWQVLVRPARRAGVGVRMRIVPIGPRDATDAVVDAEVLGVEEGGTRIVGFSDEGPLSSLGTMPLPPYIREPLSDPERYQTVYARVEGSAAAPTAGLHFTAGVIDSLRERGVQGVFVTLHVGLDTFQPVREDDPGEHRMHREYGVITAGAAAELSRAKAEGRRVICVGTTAMRLVEAAARAGTPGEGYAEWVELFILPGHEFRVADGIITNFHLPRTTLLMLVSAFAGREFVLDAYRTAIAQDYRFYSFGDAMLII